LVEKPRRPGREFEYQFSGFRRAMFRVNVAGHLKPTLASTYFMACGLYYRFKQQLHLFSNKFREICFMEERRHAKKEILDLYSSGDNSTAHIGLRVLFPDG